MTFDIQKYQKFALMQLKGRWKIAVSGTLVTMLLLVIFSFAKAKTPSVDYNTLISASTEELLSMFQNSSTTGAALLIDFLETIIDFIVEIVLVTFFLIFSRSPDPVTMKNYFEGYNKWARGILSGLWKLLWLFLWGLIAIPVLMIYAIIVVYLPVQPSETVSKILALIVIFIGFIPMFIKMLEYSFSFFFASEFPEVGIRKALRLSICIVKGHRADVFLLNLSFIGFFLLSMITLGIGFLWYIPYYYMTLTNAYHALLQDALETGKIKPEELNS